MNNLKKYYVHVGLPIFLLSLTTLFFFGSIVRTVQGNPHPQINYLIFVLIVAGTFMMVYHVRRIVQENEWITKFFAALRQHDPSVAQGVLQQAQRAGAEVTQVLDFMVDVANKQTTSVQHAAVEAEVQAYREKQTRALYWPQSLAGMMVGMGLVGTFVGLLGALQEIAVLIGSFNMISGSDPVASVGRLVENLTTPMRAMGVAFSASLFGVMGSLYMGVLMVSIKSAMSDLVGILQARVAHVLDFGAEAEGVEGGGKLSVPNLDPLNSALNELAQNSPILQSLIIALDQSERRVRELLTGVAQLAAKIDASTRENASVVGLVQQELETHKFTLQGVETLRQDFTKMLGAQSMISDAVGQIAQTFAAQQQTMNTYLEQQTRHMTTLQDQQDQFAQQQQGLWQEQLSVQRGMLQQQQAHLNESVKAVESSLSLARKLSQDQVAADKQAWMELFKQQDAAMALQRKQTIDLGEIERANWQAQHKNNESELLAVFKILQDQAGAERQHWASQMQALLQTAQSGQVAVGALSKHIETLLSEQGRQINRMTEVLSGDRQTYVHGQQALERMLSETTQAVRQDSNARGELLLKLDAQMAEQQSRHEQLMHTLITQLRSRPSA